MTPRMVTVMTQSPATSKINIASLIAALSAVVAFLEANGTTGIFPEEWKPYLMIVVAVINVVILVIRTFDREIGPTTAADKAGTYKDPNMAGR